MKKLFMGALALFILGVGAQAQVKDAGKADRHQHRKTAMKDMNFTQEQKEKLRAIREDQRKEFSNLAGSGLSEDQLKTKRSELHKKYRSQAEAVYTPEQKEQMKKMRATHKFKGRKHEEKKSTVTK